MHPTAEQGFARMLRAAQPLPIRNGVLDVGGADINGTIHNWVRQWYGGQIDVMDIAPGPGVTIVADATKASAWTEMRDYDLVISTETLEHVKYWPTIVHGAYTVLRPGGWFIGTCASTGRRAHGARGEYDPPEGEWYANIEPSELTDALLCYFDGEVAVEYSRRPEFPTTNDLYWRAQVKSC